MSIQDDTGCVVVVTSPRPGGELVAHVPVTDAAEAVAVATWSAEPGAEIYHLIPEGAYRAWHEWAHPDYYATAAHLAAQGIAEPTLGRIDVQALRAGIASGALTYDPTVHTGPDGGPVTTGGTA